MSASEQAINAIKAHQELMEAGFSNEQSAVLVQIFFQQLAAPLTTKVDLEQAVASLKLEMRHEFEMFRFQTVIAAAGAVVATVAALIAFQQLSPLLSQ